MSDVANCADVDVGLAPDKFFFLGYLPDNQLTAVWQGCSCLIFPSLYEGFGIPVLEAMQFGKPVLCSNVTSLPEVAGDTALMVAPEDTDGLAAAIGRLLDDATLRAELARRGRARAATFTWERCAAATVEVYRSLYREVYG